jgi:HAE1 family hydrophobic/amphiphilic exporter-1
MGFLIDISLRWRWVTVFIALLVVVSGVYSLNRLQVELLPDIDFPIVTVVTVYPGSNAEQVLSDVTDPIETLISDLDGIRTLQSTSSPGISLIIAEFEFGEDMANIESLLTDTLSGIKFVDPVQRPNVTRVNPDEIPILQISILKQSGLKDLVPLIEGEILPALRSVNGVVSAEVPIKALAGTSLTRTNGQPSLPVNVLKHADSNTVKVVDAALSQLDILKTTLPQDLEIVIVSNQAPEIKGSIESLQREALLGGLFAMAMIFLLLVSVRSTVVAAVSIPLSIMIGFVLMNWQNMSLNVMTLGGLAIAVGRVVDDSIVVLENIYRHIKMSKGTETSIVSALKGTKEVSGAILSATLTTVAVFLPLAFIGGIIGAFFLPFALTVTFALIASLLVSLTIVPVLGSFLIRTGSSSDRLERWLNRLYGPPLKWALRHRLATLIIAALLFLGTLGLFPYIPQSFLPGGGESLLSAEVTLSRPMPIDKMVSSGGPVAQIETVLGNLRQTGKVEIFRVTAGGSDVAFDRLDTATGGLISVFLRLTEGTDAREVADFLRSELKGEDRAVMVETVQTNGPPSAGLELTLTGDDYAKVSGFAETVILAIQDVEGLVNVKGNIAISEQFGRYLIYRYNGNESVRITGSITSEDTQLVNTMVNQEIDGLGLPEGVTLGTGGVAQDIQEAFIKMGIAMLASVVLVYLAMLITLRSFISPLVIVFSLPLASIGALAALFITQRTLGLPALIGMLMLIGLVVTNAIVLIAFVEQLRQRGYKLYDALIEGGKLRVRPILMTALTTIFALIPLAVVTDQQATIIGAELATVVIGGLATSTFLTLVVIPVIYSVFRKEKAQ